MHTDGMVRLLLLQGQNSLSNQQLACALHARQPATEL
jgi:hypothetical protein